MTLFFGRGTWAWPLLQYSPAHCGWCSQPQPPCSAPCPLLPRHQAAQCQVPASLANAEGRRVHSGLTSYIPASCRTSAGVQLSCQTF